ncbi:MAG: phenylacetate--CoA ligase family protein [Betaproteobacteria bacterium]|jgi:phenylacetate-CoA ligase
MNLQQQAHAHQALSSSALSGALWPGLPGIAGQRMLAMQFQFAQSERWHPGQIAAAQFRQIALLLRHARDTVPFYRERFAGFDFSGEVGNALFSRLPLLRREDLQQHFDALRSTALPRDHGRVIEGGTSGSTGMPIRFLASEVCEALWHAFTLRDHLWHRREFSGKLAAIRSRVTPGAGSGWGESTDSVFRTGPAVMCNTELPIAEQAQWLMRENPDYLISVASNVQALARHCAAQGLRPSRLKEVRTYGEALHPDARGEIAAAWGVPLTDLYSCREAGYLALQCPGREHYHVQAEGVYLEILRADGSACAPGETGQVVITVLHNFALPLIRYAIGDHAEAGAACDCGRGLPVIRRILGRVRNMLRLPDGGVRYPRFGETQFALVAPVRQFQVIQRSLREIEVALVVARVLSAGEEDALRALVAKNLGAVFDIRFSYHDEIQRLPSGKYEDFRSEVLP